MSDYLKQLHTERNTAFTQARSIVERAHEERRADLTGEEEAAYQRATAEVRDLDARIAEIVETRDAERVAAEARAPFAGLVQPELAEHRDTHRGALERFFTIPGSPPVDLDFTGYRVTAPNGIVTVENRSIYAYAGAGTLGGLAPTLTAHELYQVLLDQGAIWQLGVDVRATPDGNPRNWPKATAFGTATIAAEGAALTAGDPTLGTVLTSPVAYKLVNQVSSEVVQDSAVDLLGFIAQHAGKAMARSYGPHFATGTGSGQPQGYVTGGSVTVQSAGSITAEAMIKLQHSVAPPYRRNAKFATNDGNMSVLRRLRADASGTTGPFLLSPPSTPGALDMFGGAPVVIDNNLTAHGSGVKSVAYGDFTAGYIVHDGGFRFERSDDAAFLNDLVSFRAVWRMDGRVRDTGAYGLWQATAN